MLLASELVVHGVVLVWPWVYDSWCECGGCQQGRHITPAHTLCPFLL